MSRFPHLSTMLVALLLQAMASIPLLAAAVEYRIDPVHTRILFRVDHAGYSRAMGTFSGIEGRLRFDPDDPAGATLDVRIPMARLDLGDDVELWIEGEAIRARKRAEDGAGMATPREDDDADPR